jgi:hypothetical protein
LEQQHQKVVEQEVLVIEVVLMDHLLEILEDLEVAVMDLIVPVQVEQQFNLHNH